VQKHPVALYLDDDLTERQRRRAEYELAIDLAYDLIDEADVSSQPQCVEDIAAWLVAENGYDLAGEAEVDQDGTAWRGSLRYVPLLSVVHALSVARAMIFRSGGTVAPPLARRVTVRSPHGRRHRRQRVKAARGSPSADLPRPRSSSPRALLGRAA
jgi:hypothetical protein